MDKRIYKTLKNIEESFLSLVEKKGLDNISVKDLCEEAAINKTTFYCHYDGLYQLVDSLQEKAIEEVSEKIECKRENPQISDYLIILFQRFKGNKKVQALLKSSRKDKFVDHLFCKIKERFYQDNPSFASRYNGDFTLRFVFYGLLAVQDSIPDDEETKKDAIEQLSDFLERVCEPPMVSS